jgi:hypothetical protein
VESNFALSTLHFPLSQVVGGAGFEPATAGV